MFHIDANVSQIFFTYLQHVEPGIVEPGGGGGGVHISSLSKFPWFLFFKQLSKDVPLGISS